MLGISRGSLREGLAILEFLGVIVSEGKKRILIRDTSKIQRLLDLLKISFDNDIVCNLLEFRHFLDMSIVKLACQRANEEDFKKLENNVNKLIENPEDKKHDFLFHINLSKATHNPFFVAIEELLIYMYEIIREKSTTFPDRKKEIINEHGEILKAIKKRDIHLAREKTRYHLKNIGKTLKSNFS